jgi:hypothetical protein
MVINKPTSNDFERQSIQYLNQALDVLFRYSDTEDLEDETGVTEEAYWKYHQGELANSVALLFLSIENQLKARICSISPYLLVAGEPRKWGVLGTDKEFSDLFIHSFDDLMVLYAELGLGVIAPEARISLEELRAVRNRITHGVMREQLTPEAVINLIQQGIHAVWGPRVWWDQLRKHAKASPVFGLIDPDADIGWNTVTIDHFVKLIGPKKTGDLLGVNLKSRLYFCPTCTPSLQSQGHDEGSKYCTLIPNTPESTTLYCIVCDSTHNVVRQNCTEKGCPGNVISKDDVCLTCFND